MRGSQGHAGTVPMSMRQDPMAAAAELIVLLESVCIKIFYLMMVIAMIYHWNHFPVL